MRFSIPSLLTLLLFLSCEEALEYNPLDPDNNPDFVEPETVITIDNLEGTTLDTSILQEGLDEKKALEEMLMKGASPGFGDAAPAMFFVG